MMCDDGMGLWHAAYVTLFGVGCVSVAIVAMFVGWALWQDAKRWITGEPEMERRSSAVTIGFSPNRRRHPDGFTRVN